MRSPLIALAAVGGALALAHPLVPSQAQQRIEQRIAASYRYVPVQAPPAWHYVSWEPADAGRGLSIWFASSGETRPTWGFHVVDTRCSDLGRPMKRYRFGAVVVLWSTTYEDGQSWRCLGPRRVALVSFAGRPVVALPRPTPRRAGQLRRDRDANAGAGRPPRPGDRRDAGDHAPPALARHVEVPGRGQAWVRPGSGPGQAWARPRRTTTPSSSA